MMKGWSARCSASIRWWAIARAPALVASRMERDEQAEKTKRAVDRTAMELGLV